VSTGSKLLLGGGFIAIIIGLGAADAFLVEGGLPGMGEPPPAGESQASSPPPMETEQPPAEGTAPAGVKKQKGPDVLQVLAALEFTPMETAEPSILSKIIPRDGAEVHTRVLLLQEDRAGLLSWVASPQVKSSFLALKEALHSSFSSDLRDLVDERQTREGFPPRELLTFVDPAISEERIVFVRVRELLYEFHIAEGRDDTIFALIEELTK
jgi:hypothetical protein